MKMNKNMLFNIFLLAFLCWYPVWSVGSKNADYNPVQNQGITPVKYPRDNVVTYTSQVTPYPNNPKAVELFNSYFQSEVKNCAQLSDLFDAVRLFTREEVADAIFYLVLSMQERLGYETAVQNAAVSQRYVTAINDKPTPQLLLDVYSNAVSLYYYQRGYLFNENARNLAVRYALLMKAAADRIVNKDCPKSKISAIAIGLRDFYSKERFNSEQEVEDISELYGSLWLGRNGTGTPADRSTYPVFYPNPPLLKECNNLCSIESEAIEIFTSTFSYYVSNSETLKDLFNLYSLTPVDVATGLFYTSVYFTQLREIEDVAGLSDFMSRYARDVKSLKPEIVELVHSRFMAKILESRNILTIKNAKAWAEKYAELLEDKANTFVNPQYPKSKVVTLRFAFGQFYIRSGAVVDAFDQETYPALAYYYGNEWRCQCL